MLGFSERDLDKSTEEALAKPVTPRSRAGALGCGVELSAGWIEGLS